MTRTKIAELESGTKMSSPILFVRGLLDVDLLASKIVYVYFFFGGGSHDGCHPPRPCFSISSFHHDGKIPPPSSSPPFGSGKSLSLSLSLSLTHTHTHSFVFLSYGFIVFLCVYVVLWWWWWWWYGNKMSG